MAKNFNKGIDNVFSSTTSEKGNVFSATVKGLDEKKEVVKAGESGEKGKAGEVETILTESKKKKEENAAMVAYNLRYPKELQKRIKRFCIEHDGIDMKDVFTQGAIMFMNENKKTGIGALVD